MNNDKKIYLAVALISLCVLYFTGWLWPIIRFGLTLAIVSALVATIYFAYMAFVANRNLNSAGESEPSRQSIHLAIAFATATLFFSTLLAFAPAADIAPQTDPVVSAPPQTAPVVGPSSQSVPVVSKPSETRSQSKTERRSEATANNRSRRASGTNAENQLMNVLAGAIQQEQQQRQVQRQQQNARTIRALTEKPKCHKCGGAGSYRYVDQSGQLQVNNCPDCMGTGNAY